MKNHHKKTLLSVMFSLLLAITGGFFLNFQKFPLIANADDLFTPSYLSIFKYTESSTPGEYTKTGNTISRLDGVYLNEDQIVILRLAHPDEAVSYGNYKIEVYGTEIFLNKSAITWRPEYTVNNYNETQYDYIEMRFNVWASPYGTEEPDDEGRYDISIQYVEYFNGVALPSKTLTYSFYLFKTSSYYLGTYPAVTILNLASSSDTILAGASASYARTFQYYYKNNAPSETRLSLPELSYNPQKFEIRITKTIYGINTVSYISLNSSGEIVQTNPIVKIRKTGETNAIINFNDIGNYQIDYIFVHKYLDNDVIVTEPLTNVTNQTKYDRMNLFGFQLFHTDINSSEAQNRLEFKSFDSNNILRTGFQTDVTYTHISDNSTNARYISFAEEGLNSYSIVQTDGMSETFPLSTINFNNEILTLPSTNQAPVELEFNGSILTDNSSLINDSYYLKLDHYDSTAGNTRNIWKMERNYRGTAFTEPGTYLVKVRYQSQICMQPERFFTQWFFFKIVSETPNYTVTTQSGTNLLSNAFTKESVIVNAIESEYNNPFNSPTQLFVYSKSFESSTYSNETLINPQSPTSFSSKANYKAVIKFGKNFSKSKSSYFTIDTDEISGITTRTVSFIDGNYQKNSAINFFSNSDVAVEWNEKAASGNITTAQYKFIPITKTTSTFSHAQLLNYYENLSHYIPVNYEITYNGGLIQAAPYSNTVGSLTVPTEKVKSQEGIYLFKISDLAGNVAYHSFVIEKSAPRVLQKTLGEYQTDFSTLNLVSENTTIQWGEYKVIKFSGLDLTGIDLNDWTIPDGPDPGTERDDPNIDPWLLLLFRNKATTLEMSNSNADFKRILIGSETNLFLSSKIKTSEVMVQIGEKRVIAQTENIYAGGEPLPVEQIGGINYCFGYQINIANLAGTIIYENTYSFFVNDESQTRTGEFATTHNIEVSTDISKTSVRFATNVPSNPYDGLSRHDYELTDLSNPNNSTKSLFYMPISIDLLELQYKVSPDPGSIELDEIIIYFYQYVSNYLIYTGPTGILQNNMYYTLDEEIEYETGQFATLQYCLTQNIFSYSNFQVGTSFVLSKTPIEIIVYSFEENINLGNIDGDLYVWDINTVYDTTSGKTLTNEGKYEIFRTYRNLEGVSTLVAGNYDFMTRKITFYVDRQDIISSPIVLYIEPDPNQPIQQENYIQISRVGGHGYLEVLYISPSGSGLEENKFKELFRAKNLNPASKLNIFETNKLPVKISMPLLKFGDLIGSNFTAFANSLFYDSVPNSYIKTFEITISLKHLPTGTITAQTYTIEASNLPHIPGSGKSSIQFAPNLYLITTGITNGYIDFPTFHTSGQYEITLSQNNSLFKGNHLNLIFYLEIKNQAPVFSVEDSNGNPLQPNIDETLYYTNDEQIKVIWTDSTSPYMAKINLNKIQYFVGTGSLQTVNPVDITTEGYNHYFSLNISGLTSGARVTILVEYEGQEYYYSPGFFRSSKVVEIDRIAPTASIEKLITKVNASSIINSANLRQGHQQQVKYNRTTKDPTSIFKNFAFAVDVRDFNTLIYSNLESELYYKNVPNKYSDISYSELDPALSPLSTIRYSGDYTRILDIQEIYDLVSSSAFIPSYYEIVEVDFAGNITVYSIYLTDLSKFAINEDLNNNGILDSNEDINENGFLDVNNQDLLSYVSDISGDLKLKQDEIVRKNYNSTIFSKGKFELIRINAFDYPWSIISYNNISYLNSPNLEDGQVYKWATTITTTTLSNEINLGVSRYNYPIMIKNVPYLNINIQVVVSNAILDISEPSGIATSLTVTKTLANDTQYINWTSITIWEYIGGNVTRTAELKNGVSEQGVTINNILSYNVVGNVTTFQIANVNASAGPHYRFRIFDNFSQTYTFHHLYGQEFVETISNEDGLATMKTDFFYENEGDEPQLLYISNKPFIFRFYKSITTVKLTVMAFNSVLGYGWSATNIYNISKDLIPNLSCFGIINNSNPSFIELNLRPNLEHLDYILNFANPNFTGPSFYYIIESTTNVLSGVVGEDATEIETFRFNVNMLLPKIELRGKYRQDLNGLFINNNMTSDPVTVEFADTSIFTYPVEIWISKNGEPLQKITSGQTFTDVGVYTIVRKWTNAMDVFEEPQLSFTISDAASQFYNVAVKVTGEERYAVISTTGNPYVLVDSQSSGLTSIYSHYIVNTLDFVINLNTSQNVEILENTYENQTLKFTDTKNGVNTFIRTISNYNSSPTSYVNYFETKIAITYIPPSSKLLNNFTYTDTQVDQRPFTYSELIYSINKSAQSADSLIISWNNYYRIPENKVIVEIRYGLENQLISLAGMTTRNEVNSIILNRSGYYLFTFRDLAGNIHKFDYSASVLNSSTSYEFVYIKNVVFNVNNASPIPYAIYNSDVVINLPSDSLAYYDVNAQPSIKVLKNGEIYKDYTSSTAERKYTFTEPGLYQVSFSAKRLGNEIREETYSFQIIRANELCWTFNIDQYENYYIKQIIKNGVDITRALSNSSIGAIIYVQTVLPNESVVNLPYLKELWVSLYDEKTGAGNYSITIGTNNDLGQEFSFSFKINSATAPISVSLAEGESTTDTITVKFNAKNLFDNVGDCIVRIYPNKDIIINSEYFEQPDYIENYEVNITKIGDSYVQILTPSGRLLYSYRVIRNQPLNSIAIILITVASLVGIGLTIMFILLRRRMKIR